jgi:hypothetical protein
MTDMIDDWMITPDWGLGGQYEAAIPEVGSVTAVTSGVCAALEEVIEWQRAERERGLRELEAYRVHQLEGITHRSRAGAVEVAPVLDDSDHRRMRLYNTARAMLRTRLPEEAATLLALADELPGWVMPIFGPLMRGPSALRRFARWVETHVRQGEDRDAVSAFINEALEAYERLGVADARRLLAQSLADVRRVGPTPIFMRPRTRRSMRPPGRVVAAEPCTAHSPPRALSRFLTVGAPAA